MVQLLLAGGAQITPVGATVDPAVADMMGAAALRGYAEVLEALLGARDVFRTPECITAALSCAVSNHRLSTVKMLLQNKYSPVASDDAWGELSVTYGHEQGVCYDISAQLLLYLFAAEAAQPGGLNADAFATRLAAMLEVPVPVRVDRAALSLALLRGWCGDTAELTAAQDAAAELGRGQQQQRQPRGSCWCRWAWAEISLEGGRAGALASDSLLSYSSCVGADHRWWQCWGRGLQQQRQVLGADCAYWALHIGLC